MAIPIGPNDRLDQFTASSGQTIFTYSFPIFDETGLNVYQTPSGNAANDSVDLLTYGVDYTVTGVGEAGGGTIVLTIGAALNDRITILGNTPEERTTNFGDDQPFSYDAINLQLNTNIILIQELNTILNRKTPHYQNSDVIASKDQLLPVLAAYQFWMMNSSNTGIIAAALEPNANVNTLRSELASQTPGASGSLLVGYDSPLSGGITVKTALDNYAAYAAEIAALTALVNGLTQPGDMAISLNSTIPSSWLQMNDGTIGNASSNGSTRANADTENLFRVLWAFPATWFPMYTSAGVLQARGASATADFAANNAIQLGHYAGRALCVSGSGSFIKTFTASGNNLTVDNNGSLYIGTPVTVSNTGGALPSPLAPSTTYYITNQSGVGVVQLATTLANAVAGTAINLTTAGTGTNTLIVSLAIPNAGAEGAYIGEIAHANTIAETPNHAHPYSKNTENENGNPGGTTPWFWEQGSGTTSAVGGSGAHNNMQPSNFVIVRIKL